MNRTEMFFITNNDSFLHTLVTESGRNIDVFPDEDVPAVSGQNYTMFEDEYRYFGKLCFVVIEENWRLAFNDVAHQYTFEDYLDDLSVALGNESNNGVLVSPVEPIFYPNLDETCEHKHELNAVHDFGEHLHYSIWGISMNTVPEQSGQYTLQELFNEYDRVVQNSAFAMESPVTQSEGLQIGYGDRNNAYDANTSQTLGTCHFCTIGGKNKVDILKPSNRMREQSVRFHRPNDEFCDHNIICIMCRLTPSRFSEWVWSLWDGKSRKSDLRYQ